MFYDDIMERFFNGIGFIVDYDWESFFKIVLEGGYCIFLFFEVLEVV